MDVRMTIGTVLPHIAEDRFQVAGNALYAFVHSTKGVIRLVVVELWDRLNRPPASRGMAVLARYR